MTPSWNKIPSSIGQLPVPTALNARSPTLFRNTIHEMEQKVNPDFSFYPTFGTGTTNCSLKFRARRSRLGPLLEGSAAILNTGDCQWQSHIKTMCQPNRLTGGVSSVFPLHCNAFTTLPPARRTASHLPQRGRQGYAACRSNYNLSRRKMSHTIGP